MALLHSEDYDAALLVLTATCGNVLGSTVNWSLGRFADSKLTSKWAPFNQRQVEKAKLRLRTFGVWSLLLAWVPVIGDPLTFVAGMLRVPLPIFLTLVLLGKGGRYVFLALAI